PRSSNTSNAMPTLRCRRPDEGRGSIKETLMTMIQAAKAQQFRALHEAPEAFVVANVWDGGSARMMAALVFAALATSSGASAGLARSARRPGNARRGVGPGSGDLRCHGSSRLGRPWEGFWGHARDCGGDDQVGGGGGAGRLLDRGRD